METLMFKKKKLEVKLPSLEKLENIPIPEEPLSLEYLQSLVDKEEIQKIILERHGLQSEDLFKTLPNPMYAEVKWDENELLKIALMYLECVPRILISEFYDKEHKNYGRIDMRSLISTLFRSRFSDKLKSKISFNKSNIDFSIKRAAEVFKCRNVIDKISEITGLKLKQLFAKPLFVYKVSNGNYFNVICQRFLDKITSNDINDNNVIISALISQYFTKEARAFLPGNLRKK